MKWYLYLLCIFTAFLASLIIYYIFTKQKKRKTDNGSPSSRYTTIRQSLPVGTKTGWRLTGVENGFRLWKKSSLDGSIFASSTTIPVSVETLKDIFVDPTKLTEWDPGVKSVSIISMSNGKDSSSQSCGDVISVTEVDKSCYICATISSLIGQNQPKLHSRTWRHEEDIQFWLHSAVVDPQKSDPFYTLFVAFPMKDPMFCELTIVCDALSTFDHSSVTAKLAGLRDYVNCSQSEVRYPEIEVQESTAPLVDDEETGLSKNLDDLSPAPEENSSATSDAFVDITGVYLKNDVQRYKPVIDNALAKLMEYYHVKDGEKGWSFVATIKNVEVFKKPASAGFSNWDCSRGTCEVNVPIHYLIAYCNDMEHNSEYDDMFHTGHLVEQLGELTTIVYLEYKAIWPVSGRDFCAMNAIRIVKDDLYVMVARSVKHPSCPQSKKYVRGKILMGGFVMKILSEDPPRIMLSYITHVDLAGSVPARIVNKVTANQPLSVGIIKTRAEKMYQDELAKPGCDPRYSQNVKVMSEKLERAREVFENSKLTETTDGAGASGTPETLGTAGTLGTSSASLTSGTPGAQGTPRTSGMAGTSRTLEDLPQSSTPVPSANGDIVRPATSGENWHPITHSASFPQFHSSSASSEQSPFDNVKAEFKTIANQASAGLLQEVFEVAEVDITKPVSSSPSAYERWEYRGTEKDVMMFRKIHANEKMHSIIGKGIIPCSPSAVWEVLKEPNLRYHYDNMLKETRILEQISDSVMIEYLHFETANCFQKQARDFVVLRSHRKEKDKYLLSATSVEYPNSPSKKDVRRGKILASGWVIEPLLHNSQLYSMVTYLSQVNPGGSYPVNLINLVAKKQPMCVAYLRKYIIESRNFNMTM